MVSAAVLALVLLATSMGIGSGQTDAARRPRTIVLPLHTTSRNMDTSVDRRSPQPQSRNVTIPGSPSLTYHVDLQFGTPRQGAPPQVVRGVYLPPPPTSSFSHITSRALASGCSCGASSIQGAQPSVRPPSPAPSRAPRPDDAVELH